MSDLSLQAQQQLFTRHIRQPLEHSAPAGIEDRRMAIYRDLFFNNIESFVSSAFPVFRSLFTDSAWQQLIRDFFAQHKAQSPYFLEISEEFLSYLQNDELSVHQTLPFAKELCHYEWLELALDVADDETLEADACIDPFGDLLSHSIILSPFIWAQAYAWPVHEIGPDNIPQQASEQANCLLVYRTDNFNVEFMHINAATFQLLNIIEAQPELNGEAVIQVLANQLSQEFTQSFCDYAIDILEKFRVTGIVKGTSSL